MVAHAQLPTVWGLTPIQLHDRFWASQGVQVVRQGEPSEIVEGAELFLLTDAGSLVVFNVASQKVLDVLHWMEPDLLQIRLIDERERGYCESAVSDFNRRFVR